MGILLWRALDDACAELSKFVASLATYFQPSRFEGMKDMTTSGPMVEFRKDLFADERDDNLNEVGKPTRPTGPTSGPQKVL